MPKTSNNPNLASKLAKDSIAIEKRHLTIEYVPLDAIWPNDYNPNEHDPDTFDLLCKSLLYFGFTMPIVVNRRDMRIVDGENRFRAACVLGLKMIPVCFVDWDEEKAKYATIMHNAARGHDNGEMMSRLTEFLDTQFKNNSDKVLLKYRSNDGKGARNENNSKNE